MVHLTLQRQFIDWFLQWSIQQFLSCSFSGSFNSVFNFSTTHCVCTHSGWYYCWWRAPRTDATADVHKLFLVSYCKNMGCFHFYKCYGQTYGMYLSLGGNRCKLPPGNKYHSYCEEKWAAVEKELIFSWLTRCNVSAFPWCDLQAALWLLPT